MTRFTVLTARILLALIVAATAYAGGAEPSSHTDQPAAEQMLNEARAL